MQENKAEFLKGLEALLKTDPRYQIDKIELEVKENVETILVYFVKCKDPMRIPASFNSNAANLRAVARIL